MNKKTVTGIAFEFISVVFAVLLALGLNAAKENWDKEVQAQQIKKAIIKECRLNLAKVDSTLTINQTYAHYLDSLVQLDPDEVNGFYFAYEFELLNNSAWQLSQNNPVTHSLQEEFLLAAADIYQTQNFYQNFSEKLFQSMGNFIVDMENVKESSLALSMYYNIGVMNNTAEDLKQQYADFLEKYGKANP